MSEQPKSKNLGRFTVGKYVVTCAAWDGGYGYSYELGIRDTSLDREDRDHFFLIQSEYFREFNIRHYGALAATMLSRGGTPKGVSWTFQDADTLEPDAAKEQS